MDYFQDEFRNSLLRAMKLNTFAWNENAKGTANIYFSNKGGDLPHFTTQSINVTFKIYPNFPNIRPPILVRF